MTHYDIKGMKKIKDGEKLLNLCLKIKAIFQIIILIDLGFNENKINEIIDNEFNGLKHKLTLNI